MSAFPCMVALLALGLPLPAATAQPVDSAARAASALLAGPINARFPAAGTAIRKDLAAPITAQPGWAIMGWIKLDALSATSRPVLALVDDKGNSLVELGLDGGSLYAAVGTARTAIPMPGKAGDWHMVSLALDTGQLTLRAGDKQANSRIVAPVPAPVAMLLAPRLPGQGVFRGAVANLVMWQGESATARRFATSRPDEQLIEFDSGSPTWPLQTKQTVGLSAPQDPATLPVSRAATPRLPAPMTPASTPPLTLAGDGRWRVGSWQFVAEPEVKADPAAIAQPGFKAAGWLPAVVPGTVLTSYVANGVYPDPAHGLNNLLVPERLNKQDYWYRTEFERPVSPGRTRLALAFEGINYAAEIWVNGERLGASEGAFIRGRLELPARFQSASRLAVAVRVAPPPHPDRPHEESLTAGPGQNGGAMMIDGPTFGAAQGWDWIPSVRDRNTGIWQDVLLQATGDARLGDPNVTTVLPLPDNSVAELTISVPVSNDGAIEQDVVVEARVAGAILRETARVAPGATSSVRFTPARHAALRVRNPQLWWPNGYGAAALQDLAVVAKVGDLVSDSRSIRFGIREISYELSAVDANEELRRVALAPARSPGEALINVAHEGIRKVAGGWAVSLAREPAGSPALTSVADTTLAPHLLIKVNGVPIAVRGGNWGMDDWLKRVSRERMEPYFRLHREANVNTIRNWMGQSSAPLFFDLADEYGLLVLNDFWLSTQDHNAEPGDSALFLANAADSISRFQHHASIALWIGRNEGVPPPVLNAGLDRLVRSLDGTRAYLPNSREINMAGSGPWNYQPPEAYFTRIGRGFSTEVGTPSFPTLEAFQAMMPAADQWPVSDSWAYHDWHQGKAGDVASFNKAMANRLGPPRDLADFEAKAQLLNYESHRAIFEGMNAGLFTRNSGRLLWMTQPAWPSTAWQIYSHDYDTHAAFFGAKKGSEPVHVQINLPDRGLAVVNSLAQPISGATLRVQTLALDGTSLEDRTVAVNVAGHAVASLGAAVPDALFTAAPVVLTRLSLLGSDGRLISENLYWLAQDPAAYRALAAMAPATITVTARRVTDASEQVIEAQVHNPGRQPALMVRLSARDAAGKRVLPAYASDNYVALLPGETRTISIRSPMSGPAAQSIAVQGWNVGATASTVMP
ncbi:hypothetical protein CAP39_04905 [Sphingomonas sp. IBVSS1]|nr:hypothetical protein CAP39_04905 [Sphingomonas sp. IBVSS1]